VSFLGRLFHRPEPAPIRYIVAHREESRRVRTARVHTQLQLEVAVARLTPEERAQARLRASIRPHHVNEQVGEGTNG
jgi:hypothetical protein